MVKKKWLIVTNGLVWIAAGINIARIGIGCALKVSSLVWLWSMLVFVAFGVMFLRVIKKNILRILSKEKEKLPLCAFLNARGYIIIIVMMTMGICLRKYTTLPSGFFAFFYTGLGCALAVMGLASFFMMHPQKNLSD